MKPILYLSCPPGERDDVEKALGSAQLSVVWVDSASAAATELQQRPLPVLLDLSRGAVALQHARDIRGQVPSALLFAVVDPRRPDLTAEAVIAGMADVFTRPLVGRRVAEAIDRELNPNPRTPHGPGDLYDHAPSMRAVMEAIAPAAATRSGVVIRGEDGTGRQIVARAIHAAQPAGSGPFVVFDCADHDANETDHALFGAAPPPIAKAAASLERVSKKSRLYEARHGTLYLQQIGELPTRAQARLARLLRDGEATLVETGDPVAIDVRPMAGVDPAYDAAVADGRLRDDLVKRIAAIRIDMPPLRDRREDIPAIANLALRELCARQRIPPKVLSRSALALMAALPWRGNAPELRTLLESMVQTLQSGPHIALEDVLRHVRLDGASVALQHGGTLKQARARFEREYIAAVLDQNRGRISDTARALGVQRTNLYRKMRSLRINKATSG